MLFGMKEPQEDEFAFCSLTSRTFSFAWAFPRQAKRYNRYLTLRDIPPEEVVEWQSALAGFAKKLSFKYGKPLVLKSPGHTCRIKVLLDLFPDATFVHIHRNPYDVFPSTVHTIRKVIPWWALQRPDYSNLEEAILQQYREVYDAFFDERALIPKERFCEISFERLEADPIGQMRTIYDALGLPDFAHAEPAMRKYLDSLGGYRKNAFPPLAPELRAKIARAWQRCFEEWGYPM
jgi:hypothetical protein